MPMSAPETLSSKLHGLSAKILGPDEHYDVDEDGNPLPPRLHWFAAAIADEAGAEGQNLVGAYSASECSELDIGPPLSVFDTTPEVSTPVTCTEELATETRFELEEWLSAEEISPSIFRPSHVRGRRHLRDVSQWVKDVSLHSSEDSSEDSSTSEDISCDTSNAAQKKPATVVVSFDKSADASDSHTIDACAETASLASILSVSRSENRCANDLKPSDIWLKRKPPVLQHEDAFCATDDQLVHEELVDTSIMAKPSKYDFPSAPKKKKPRKLIPKGKVADLKKAFEFS